MDKELKFNSAKEFYPYYLTEHLNPICRAFHLFGTTLVILLFAAGIATLNWKFFALMPVAGYGNAWIGHFFFEKNKPAAFGNPLYSLSGDFRMYWHFITGQLSNQLESAKKQYPKT